MENCEKADWNGHYRDNGTFNKKVGYCHVNDPSKEICYDGKIWASFCDGDGIFFWNYDVTGTQDNVVPPTDGWTDLSGSASSLRIVYGSPC